MTVEIYAETGDLASWDSSLYTATVDGSDCAIWSYTRTTRMQSRVWAQGASVEVSVLKFGSDAVTTVVITKLAGAISTCELIPGNTDASYEINSGILTITCPSEVDLVVNIDDDLSKPLLLFACPLKEAVPATKTDWTTLGKTISSINTTSNEITCTGHGFANGVKVHLTTTGTLPAAVAHTLQEHEYLYLNLVDANTFTLVDSGGTEVDFTDSGTGTHTVWPSFYTNTASALYFPAGEHKIGRLFDLADGVQVYHDGGSIPIGSYDLRGVDDVYINGPGFLSGSFTTYEYVETLTDAEAYEHSMFFGANGAKYNYDNAVQGITVIAQPFYLTKEGLWSFRNVQVVSPWCWEADGLKWSGKTTSPYEAEGVDCFVWVGDDALYFQEDFVSITCSGLFIVNSAGASLHGGYFPYWEDLGRSTVLDDIDVLHLGIDDLDDINGEDYPVKGGNAVFRCWTDGWEADAQSGQFRTTITNLRIWGEISRIFSLGNRMYPYTRGTPHAQYGQIANWTISFWTEQVPNQLSFLLGKDATNTPHDLTFTACYIAGTMLNDENYGDYIEPWIFPYNITFDAAPSPIPSDAENLWDEVVASFEATGLIALTNVRDPGPQTINTTTGVDAAQAVIDLWALYAQGTYDPDNPLHVQVAKRAVIATLWSRGGTATNIAKVEWDEVYGDTGLLAKVRRTGARGRAGPRSNSGYTASSDLIDGRRSRPWSDPASLPVNFLPSSRSSSSD